MMPAIASTADTVHARRREGDVVVMRFMLLLPLFPCFAADVNLV